VRDCYNVVRSALLAEKQRASHWTGELSTSALSTAVAVMALEMVRGGGARQPSPPDGSSQFAQLGSLIENGLQWLAAHQNADGGWGDTTKSSSNISTTMLAHAVFHATAASERFDSVVKRARDYIDKAGGAAAVVKRYGKDRTFSVPILTHCALAGLVSWKEVAALPFELACLPPRFYKTVRLPVVSYALPALIAIGQVRHHYCPSRSPTVNLLRSRAIGPSLRVLERIQPSNGGFLEATPLTSFVTMSLAGKGLTDHPVVRRGVQFIIESVRPDGSWPIDTNLATWVTTMSVSALGDDLPAHDRPGLREWLLDQQFLAVHPFTNADPGGWAWTNLAGGVPDADDTPGAVLALLNLRDEDAPAFELARQDRALSAAVRWLLDLQNRDGGWPTFCRGWGTLPFDRSAPDISAHVLRALWAWSARETAVEGDAVLWDKARSAVATGFRYLSRTQRRDGSWLPLWFGNEHVADEANPTYGTARVLAAYRDTGRQASMEAQRGLGWLIAAQSPDGGWGGGPGAPSTVEETAVATEILLAARPEHAATRRGLAWLLDCVESGRSSEPSPIGFYFAKLWYFERLYPLAWIVSALRTACRCAAFDISPARSEEPVAVASGQL
jgi:squalene-hopene/tetraprenyl-beta-curcumene cyclase